MTNRRYADDIKRIVGIDTNQSFLPDAKPRGQILGNRGIAYFISGTGSGNQGSGGSSTAGNVRTQYGISGQTVLQNSLKGGEGYTENNKNKFKEEENGEGGQDGQNSKDSQTGVRTTTSGVKSVKDVVDGTTPEGKISVPEVWENGSVISGNPVLNGVTGTNCSTGDDIEIRFDGADLGYIPPLEQTDSNGNITSNAWTDAETPPNKPDVVDGDYWVWSDATAGINYYGVSWKDFIQTQQELLNTYDPDVSGDPPYTWTGNLINTDSDEDGLIQCQPTYTATGSTTPFSIGGNIERNTGSMPPADETNIIIETNLKEEFWPDDGKIDFKFENGQFKTSQYDREVPPENVNPSNRVDFCDDGRTFRTEVTKHNGFMLYETDGGAVSGIIKVYDSSRQLVAAFDAASGLIDVYRP